MQCEQIAVKYINIAPSTHTHTHTHIGDYTTGEYTSISAHMLERIFSKLFDVRLFPKESACAFPLPMETMLTLSFSTLRDTFTYEFPFSLSVSFSLSAEKRDTRTNIAYARIRRTFANCVLSWNALANCVPLNHCVDGLNNEFFPFIVLFSWDLKFPANATPSVSYPQIEGKNK